MILHDTTTGEKYHYEPHGDREEIRAAFDDDSVRDTLESVLDALDANSRTGTGLVSNIGYGSDDDLTFLGLRIEEDDDDDDAFHQAVRAGAWTQREAFADQPAVPAHTVGDVQIYVNTEMKSGGLDSWPTSKHFWVMLVTPDSREQHGPEVGSWDALETLVNDAQHMYEDRRREATELVEAATGEYRDAEQALATARETLDTAVRALVGLGVSSYRAAKITGLSEPTIARIVNAPQQR